MTIQYEQTVFKDLLEAYPTWKELEAFLESEQGGQFRVVDQKGDLCIIRYEKGVSNMNLPHSRWFRSVVWNTTTNRPMCVSPPKTTQTEFPFSHVDDAVKNGIVSQELVDGVMINCFKKVGDEQLYITSRSKLNAAGNFYSPKSFRTLFIECFTGYNVDPNAVEQVIQERSHKFTSPDQEKKEVAIFYSYVIQHVEHRIVEPIKRNACVLIHKGTVYEDGRMVMEDDFPFVQSNWYELTLEKSKGSYAQVVGSSGQTIEAWAKKIFDQSSWNFQGMVLKDSTGNRWRFRSSKYTAVKSLRGNSPVVVERYAQLYSQNLIQKYLEYYPEETFVFSFHSDGMNKIVHELYQYYIALHVTKTTTVAKIDKMFSSHLYTLHGIYLSQLRPEKKKLTPVEVQTYLHKLPWQRIAFLLRRHQESYFSMLEDAVIEPFL
jgi:hypothetical protein